MDCGIFTTKQTGNKSKNQESDMKRIDVKKDFFTQMDSGVELVNSVQQNGSVSSSAKSNDDTGPIIPVAGHTVFRRRPDLFSNAPKKKIFNVSNEESKKYGDTNPTYTGEVKNCILS